MYKKLMVAAAAVAMMASSAMAVVVTYEWDVMDQAKGSWWSNYNMSETESGFTLQAAGRGAVYSGSEEATRATYVQDADPAIYTVNAGGPNLDFAALSVDMRWEGYAAGVPAGWFGVYGKLDGAIVWEIFPAVEEVDSTVFHTYDTTTHPAMAGQINSIEWFSLYDPAGANLVWGNAMDNLVVDVVPEPATLGLLGLAGAALYVRRKIA